MHIIAGGVFTFAINFLIFGHVVFDSSFSKNLVETPVISLNLEVLGAKNSSTPDQVFFAIRGLAHSTASVTVNSARITLAKMQNSSKINQEILSHKNAISKQNWIEFFNFHWLQENFLFESQKIFEQSIVYLEARLTVGRTDMKRLEKGILAMAIAETKPIKLEANHLFRRVVVTSGSGQMCISLKFCSDIAIHLRKS